MSKKIKSALLISSVNQYSTLLIQFVLGMIIARILTPEDVGVYSVGAVVISIAHMFRDFGIGKYIINEKDLTTEKLRAAFSLTLIISWSLASLLFIATPYIAEFYQTEAIREIFYVVVFNFLLIPFGSTLMTYLRRELNLKALLITGLLSNIGQAITTITLAYHGHGYMSLAWGSITNVLITILMLQFFRPKWYPILPSLKGIKDVAKFGSLASIESIFKQTGNSSPDIFIGKNLSMGDVGYFSKANSIIQIFSMLVLQAIRPIALPYFSMIEREGSDLTFAYTKIINLITIMSLSFFCFVIVAAEPLILTLFGSQWGDSIPLTQILAVGAAVTSLVAFSNLVLIPKGKIRQLAIFTSVFQPIRIIFIAIATTYSIKWTIIVYTLFNCIETISFLFMLKRYLNVKLLALFKIYFVNFTIALLSITPLLLIKSIVDFDYLNILLRLLIESSLWGLSLLLLLIASNHLIYQQVLLSFKNKRK